MSGDEASVYRRLLCDCGALALVVDGRPVVSAYCHCRSCRLFYGVDVFSASAWSPADVRIDSTAPAGLFECRHPTRRMTRRGCSGCGRTLYGTNRRGYVVIPTPLFRSPEGDVLPRSLRPRSHFFYAQRVVSIDDELPKHAGDTGDAYPDSAYSSSIGEHRHDE